MNSYIQLAIGNVIKEVAMYYESVPMNAYFLFQLQKFYVLLYTVAMQMYVKIYVRRYIKHNYVRSYKYDHT